VCLQGVGTFFDVGANIGFYSVLAHHNAPNTDILSFEPVPNIQSAARRFLAANGIPDTICPVALSDHDGTATLYQPAEDHDFGESSADTLVPNSWQARQEHSEILVEVTRLDSFLGGRVLKRPVVAKIDVEDHEAAVLRGAVNMIGTCKPIIVCEILPRPHANRETIG
jgi:FkbM family methyltransferase